MLRMNKIDGVKIDDSLQSEPIIYIPIIGHLLKSSTLSRRGREILRRLFFWS
jgi:hypothetical protein